MEKHRTFLQRRKAKRVVEHPERTRTAYARPEPAWADAWPHLDDWFTIATGMNGPIPV